MKTLLILNDPAYGTERSYNGLRLAGALAKRDDSEVRVFLLGDAVDGRPAGPRARWRPGTPGRRWWAPQGWLFDSRSPLSLR
jgi:hypothetical protein